MSWKKQGGSNRTTKGQNLSAPYFTNDISGSSLHLEVMTLDISNVRIQDKSLKHKYNSPQNDGETILFNQTNGLYWGIPELGNLNVEVLNCGDQEENKDYNLSLISPTLDGKTSNISYNEDLTFNCKSGELKLLGTTFFKSGNPFMALIEGEEQNNVSTLETERINVKLDDTNNSFLKMGIVEDQTDLNLTRTTGDIYINKEAIDAPDHNIKCDTLDVKTLIQSSNVEVTDTLTTNTLDLQTLNVPIIVNTERYTFQNTNGAINVLINSDGIIGNYKTRDPTLGDVSVTISQTDGIVANDIIATNTIKTADQNASVTISQTDGIVANDIIATNTIKTDDQNASVTISQTDGIVANEISASDIIATNTIKTDDQNASVTISQNDGIVANDISANNIIANDISANKINLPGGASTHQFDINGIELDISGSITIGTDNLKITKDTIDIKDGDNEISLNADYGVTLKDSVHKSHLLILESQLDFKSLIPQDFLILN